MVMTTNSMSVSGPNPLTADPELKALLEESNGIKTTAQFDRWRKSFLSRVDEILRKDGAGAERAAKAAYNRVSSEIDSFGRKALKLKMCVKTGSISPTHISVRGQNALNEVKDGATQAMNQLINWMPAVKKEEEALGYTKWVLGAVLVRNGFEIYETMILCRDVLQQAKIDCLDQIADRQTLDAIDYYGRQIERFCSVMSDLGLMGLMMRSSELREASGWAKNKTRSLSGNLEFMVSPVKKRKEEEEPAGRSFADGMDHLDTINIDSDSESETECADQDLDEEISLCSESETENTESNEDRKAPNKEMGEAKFAECEKPRDVIEDEDKSQQSEQTETAQQTEVYPSEEKQIEEEKSPECVGQENDKPDTDNSTNNEKDKEDEAITSAESESPRELPEEETEVNSSDQDNEAEEVGACPSKVDEHLEEEICPDTCDGVKDAGDEAKDSENEPPVNDEADRKQDTAAAKEAPASDEADQEQDTAADVSNEPSPSPTPVEEKSEQADGGDGPPRPHLRVQFGAPQLKKYDRKLRHDDCVMVPALFGKEEDLTNYYSLVEEITKLQQKGVPNANWALSHDSSHMVCEDATMSKTVESITAKICKYFQIRKDSVLVKIDMFRDGGDTKPPEHDIIAYKPKKKSDKRNIAVHVSFGVERELSLSTHGDTPIAVYFPQRNNWAFSVGRDVNVRFENGIAKSDGPCEKGRVCVRLYGKAKAVVEEEGSPELLERDDEIKK